MSSTPTRAAGTGRDERGSMAIELAMAAPALVLVLLLVFAYGRAAGVNGTLESGTRDAARSATFSRSYAEAEDRARTVVRAAVKDDVPPRGLDSLEVSVSTTFAAGEPVTVSASCRYDLADLGLPGAPGEITPESSFTSVLDPYGGVEE